MIVALIRRRKALRQCRIETSFASRAAWLRLFMNTWARRCIGESPESPRRLAVDGPEATETLIASLLHKYASGRLKGV
jgi:hypothetical protein